MDEFKMRASDVIRIIKQLQENKMMDIDKLVGRMLQLEQDYLDLKLAYDELKKEYDAYRSGHRDESETRQDSRCSNQGH